MNKFKSFLYTLFTVLSLVISAFTAQAQKSFSREPDVFLKELEAFMTKDKQENAQLAIEEFKTKWNSKTISEDVQQRIIKTYNEMLDKKMKAEPDFVHFTKTVIAFVNTGKIESHYMKWDKMVQPYYKTTSRKMADFIINTRNLLEMGGMSSTKTRTWYATSANFDFVQVGGRPAATFAKTDIKCVSAKDSTIVLETSGTYFMDDNTWVGDGGKITWERVNISPQVCFAELKKYNVDMQYGEIKADSVLFINSDFMGAKIEGRLEEKVLDFVSEERSSYPRFNSYRKDLVISKFVDNVRYVGGYAQHGSKILASGDAKSPATFRFYHKNKLVLMVEGEELFVFKNEKVVTNKATITVHLDSGSTIYHPQVNFSYIVSEQRVTITRGTEGIYRAPFVDNFHNMEINADIITWKIDEPKIDIKMILKDEAATFESNNYFREYKYEKLQGMLAYNPLQKVKQYCDEKRVKEFYLKDYAKFAGSTPENLIGQFIVLHDDGYVKFDVKTQFVKVYEKTFNYVNSHFGRTDYDVISFQSIIGGLPNASINLINYDMNIEGVPTVKFSDSQNVYVVPIEQRFVLKKNREMQFKGKVRAGRFEFFGNGFTFNYQKFIVDMNNVDSLRFYFPDENNNLVRVNSVLQDISGTLFIDQQYNKSGYKDFSDYPIFKSNKGSKVYYDQPSIFGGVYRRDKFFFSVDPFTIDSLDNFTRSGLRFDGDFHSAEIFPQMRETLVLMDDYSLGFIKTATLPMYKGIGNGAMTMNLSNQGFFGTGEIKYATSTTKSNKFAMFPDSTNGFSETFDLPESNLYPPVNGKNVYTHWEPYKDRMSQFTINEALNMYGDAKFSGEYILSRKGSNSNGALSFNDATLSSTNMKMEPKKFTADTSTLVIRSIDTAKFAFRAVNVKADMDMAKRLGDFKAIGEGANSEFPYNMYRGSLNEFKWDVKAKTLRFVTPPGKPDESSYFVSTNPLQDSLKFISKDALYDLNSFVLYANKVPFINTADSRVFPDSGKVVIRQNAEMDMLKKAKVLVDTIRKHHTLYDCNIHIAGRLDYNGNGFYDYIDRSKKKNKIYFNEITVDKFTRTATAKGNISVPDNFTLSPKILYQGAVTLTGQHKGLDFDGLFMADIGINPPETWWVRHRQIISPDSVFLFVTDPKENDKKDLFTGFTVAQDTALMYANLFSRKRNYYDGDIININKGVFYYDDNTKEFVYGDSAKIYEKAPKGNYFSYNTEKAEMYAEGNVNFALETEKFTIASAGNVKHSIKDSTFDLKTILLIDFPFPEPALKQMITNIQSSNSGMPASVESLPHVSKGLAEILDEKDYKRVKEGIDKDGGIKLISALEKTFFITDADFRWNPATRSFMADGLISVSNIGKERIGKKMEGKIEIERKRSGHEITLYFETGSGDYFYFNYVRKKLYVLSSDNTFMTLIKENLEKFTNNDFSVGLGTEQGMKKFLRNFENK